MNMFHLSLSAANAMFGVANVSIVLGALLGLGGTITAVWSGLVKERYADERISNNEVETARAKAEAAVANQRAAEATLELAKFRAPRSVPAEKKAQIHAALVVSSGMPFAMAYQQSDPEAEAFMSEIQALLVSAGWTQLDWDNAGVFGFVGVSGAGRKVGYMNTIGVTIAILPASPTTLEEMMVRLQSALAIGGIKAQLRRMPMQSSHVDALHVIIGKKAE